MQVVLVYLQPFRRNSFLHLKIAKTSLKPLFGGFKVVHNHRCWQM